MKDKIDVGQRINVGLRINVGPGKFGKKSTPNVQLYVDKKNQT